MHEYRSSNNSYRSRHWSHESQKKEWWDNQMGKVMLDSIRIYMQEKVWKNLWMNNKENTVGCETIRFDKLLGEDAKKYDETFSIVINRIVPYIKENNHYFQYNDIKKSWMPTFGNIVGEAIRYADIQLREWIRNWVIYYPIEDGFQFKVSMGKLEKNVNKWDKQNTDGLPVYEGLPNIDFSEFHYDMFYAIRWDIFRLYHTRERMGEIYDYCILRN
jgi:hypothetical protein